MVASAEQDVWVELVLGVEIRADGAAGVVPALPVWQQAKDTVDAQLNGLYDALKRTGIPGLIAFADQIENTLTKFRVGLVTALTAYDQAVGPAKQKPRAVALAVISSFRSTLANDDRVLAADTNPFVPVTIRPIVSKALDRLQKQLDVA